MRWRSGIARLVALGSAAAISQDLAGCTPSRSPRHVHWQSNARCRHRFPIVAPDKSPPALVGRKLRLELDGALKHLTREQLSRNIGPKPVTPGPMWVGRCRLR